MKNIIVNLKQDFVLKYPVDNVYLHGIVFPCISSL